MSYVRPPLTEAEIEAKGGVIVCYRCGAVVLARLQEHHDQWHDDILAYIARATFSR